DGRLCREDRFLGLVGQHHAHDLLQREDVNARLPTVEIVAGAVPLSGVETDMVRVVVTAEREREPVDRDPIELACVAVRLLDLADQGAVHRRIPPQPRSGRIHEAAVAGRAPDRWVAVVAQPYTSAPVGSPPETGLESLTMGPCAARHRGQSAADARPPDKWRTPQPPAS